MIAKTLPFSISGDIIGNWPLFAVGVLSVIAASGLLGWLMSRMPKRHAYLVPATGAVEVRGVRINARDGAAITDLATVEIVGIEDAEVILVDAA
jgi:hypothetical protein